MPLPRTYRDVAELINRPQVFRRAMNLWPPLLCSSIHIDHITDDWRDVQVTLRRNRVTANYVGTLYGGSLYSMTDPFWMLMVLHQLPRDWTVWDTGAQIDFLRPGRADVRTRFLLTDEDMAQLRATAERDGRARHWFTNEIHDRNGQLIARVRKQVYVRPPAGRA